MSPFKSNSKILSGLFIALACCLFIPQAALGQAEKLGIVRYTPPKGWTKTPNANLVALSEVNRTTGVFCIITLHGATPATGNANDDFKRAWKNLVVEPLKAQANPKTDTRSAEGWTIIGGGSEVESEAGKAVAYLTVISGFGKTISVLAVFNDPKYVEPVDAFISGLDVDKTATAGGGVRREESLPPTAAANAEAMNVVALVREFETNEVRATGLYGGKRVRVYGHANKVSIEQDGRISLMFKSSITTYANAYCYFSKSEGTRLGAVNINDVVTVEGTVVGWMKKYSDSARQVFIMENCVIP
ncbi:MAG: hypothetical protein QOD32_665 [Pyrinomonadaceae bacterium]|jgi:hypothetical protein|nr:hypothetical protein [Pyrinomonadaceae bacterium]